MTIAVGPPSLIIGPDGAGTSVLLRLMHGLPPPGEGRVTFRVADAARRRAMVFQRPVLLRRSVLENAIYPLALAGVGRAEREARARRAGGHGPRRAGRPPGAPPVGREEQRLALARAEALARELVFLDEPCASLNPAATRAVEEIVQSFARRGVKTVMTTHDLGQARRLAGEVLFLHRGRLLEQRPGRSLLHPARHCRGRRLPER